MATMAMASWKSVIPVIGGGGGGTGGGGTGGGGGGVGPARAAAGVHVDQNIYEAAPYSKPSTALAWVRGSQAIGWTGDSQIVGTRTGTPAAGMIESAPTVPVTLANWNPINSDPVLNFYSSTFGSGAGQWRLPIWVYSIYGSFTGVTPGQVGAGAIDSQLRSLADPINASPFPRVALRPGWEMDIATTNAVTFMGDVKSYPPQDWVASYRRIHDVLEPLLTKPHWWEWNAFAYHNAAFNAALIGNNSVQGAAFTGNLNAGGYNVAQYYPGDSYVDVIANDGYCQQVDPSDTYFLAPFQQCQATAKARGKLYGVSEWGLIDGENGNPLTLESTGRAANGMRAFLAFFDSCPSSGAGALAYHIWFQGNPGGADFLMENWPSAVAVYKARMLQA